MLLWRANEKLVGREECTHNYACLDATLPAPEDSAEPLGFIPCVINGIPCCHNQQPRWGTAWHSDGSKLVDTQTGAARLGAAATCVPLHIICRVMSPQDSY